MICIDCINCRETDVCHKKLYCEAKIECIRGEVLECEYFEPIDL